MAVGKYGPASIFLMVDGYNLISAKLQALRYKVTALQVRSDGLGDSWEENSPIGTKRAEITQEGAFFDTSTNNSHDALSSSVPSSPQATPRIICLGDAGQTIGEPFMGFEGVYTQEYEVIAARGDLQKANVTYVVSGKAEEGQIVQELEAKTADWDTFVDEADAADYTLARGNQSVPITSSSVANPSIITTTVPHKLTNGQKVLIAGHSGSTPSINGEYVATVITTTTFSIPENVTVGGTGGTVIASNTIAGCVGYQQVTAFSGFSGFVGTIRDSADDITYADLVVFTDVTAAPGKERKIVAGTIDRYTAFKGDVTGSGSLTIFSGLARS